MSVLTLKTKIKIFLFTVIFFTLLVISAISIEFNIVDLILGLPRIGDFIFALIKPNFNYFPTIFQKLIETIQISLLGTTIAVIISFPFSFLASSITMKNRIVYNFARIFMNFIRTVPDIVLASIFVAIFGIGALPGIIAISLFSFGIITKLLSEDIDAIDKNQVEGVLATGSNLIQTIYFSIVPQILPNFISYSLYTFEVNIRVSVVLGFVGAGGIGQILIENIRLGNYANVSMIVFITFIAVLIIDYVSEKLRSKIV
ncbi:MAG: phosphonate ABC transporter, permease protein PhnE [candidate division WOR-3 bacterium]|nr:phosphonate ABC transporter, permease protein PhnE [candidate division WOR-3 bacterium]MCX7948176.1 phosphonate ABC transporter, permease protein PhnE [candidate division WOR-3 bacterium]MDW8151128.1 phosphonate ABC transporter, permease protein PhnE [candidate division WOR-3 bacterium]